MRTTNMFLVLFFYCIALDSFSQSDDIRIKQFNTLNGLAIQGYDPVSYFTQNKALKGSSAIATKYRGITYYFASVGNKVLFDKNPVHYEPQYGGWCAYAMGDSGEKVEVDPETFKILDNKLYLFYHTWFNNTLTKWNNDETNLHMKADKNWYRIINNK
jgi:YHS domain-containing protein